MITAHVWYKIFIIVMKILSTTCAKYSKKNTFEFIVSMLLAVDEYICCTFNRISYEANAMFFLLILISQFILTLQSNYFE